MGSLIAHSINLFSLFYLHSSFWRYYRLLIGRKTRLNETGWTALDPLDVNICLTILVLLPSH